MRFLHLWGIAVTAALLITTDAQAKAAKCEMSWYGSRYIGPCDFIARRGGSFDLSINGNTWMTHDTPPYMTVEIISPGRALLGWVTPTGKEQRPEEPLRRDPKKPACWVGADIKICAY